MCVWRTKKGVHEEKGASLVETALVMTFLLLLVAGIVDFGGAFQNYIIITNAAREGARTAARLPCKRTGGSDDNTAALRNAIVQSVTREAAGSNLTLAADQITVTPDPVTESCPVAGEPFEIRVTVRYQALLGGILGMAEFPVSNSATMAFAGNDQN